MTKAERKILECFRKIAFLNEHKFELERAGVQTIFKELFEDFVGNFSEMKVRLDEAKREEDEFKKLSPEEKKQRIAEWRAKRIAEVERLKQEEKKQN